jgi:hypothetical protein
LRGRPSPFHKKLKQALILIQVFEQAAEDAYISPFARKNVFQTVKTPSVFHWFAVHTAFTPMAEVPHVQNLLG